MPHEYELIRNNLYRNLHVFLVNMFYRTPHMHRELELGLVLDGDLEIRRTYRTDRLKKGDLYLINPMEVHEFRTFGRGAYLLTIQTSYKIMNSFLREPVIPRFQPPESLRAAVASEGEYAALQKLCLELAGLYIAQPSDPFRCFHVLTDILCRLIREVPHGEMAQGDYTPMKKKADRIISILNYIDNHFSRKLLLSEIAEQENLSLTYLSHFFRDMMGISFQEYLKKRRFEEARFLTAATERPLLDIALSCGFSDVRYMTEIFVETTGLTPGEFRRRNTAPVSPGSSPFPAGTYERMLEEGEALKLLREFSASLSSPLDPAGERFEA